MLDIKKGEGKFYIGDNPEEPFAEIQFESDGDTLTVNHTFVSEELSGQGIGGQLVKQIVAFAREENKKVTPLCPYAKKKLESNPEYQDILAK
jgi:uncharacterized protein